jgi:enterochelin esterase-like enzyme
VDPESGAITFRVADDPHWRPRRVWFHLRDFGADPTFHREDEHWVAKIPRPPVDRLEYLLVVEHGDGAESMLTDPANPHRARGVFGDHSLIELPGYAPPWWITVSDAAEAQARRDAEAAVAATRRAGGERRTPWRRAQDLTLRPPDLVAVPVAGSEGPATALTGEGVTSVRATRSTTPDARLRHRFHAPQEPPGALVADPGPDPEPIVDEEAEIAITGRLHVPSDSVPDEPLPLMVVHDGPEYADLGQLLRYLSTLARIDPGLRCRVLLLTPVDRDRSYSASPAYARALVEGMLPRITGSVRTHGGLVGVGASLGGLAMLHAAVTHPGTLGGVFSQSGSFFRPRTDGMERGFRFYGRIVRFVDSVDAEPERLAGLRVSMTCGTGEENLANNRSMARRLARVGVPTDLVENPDGHNYTGWRDALDPGLRRLMRDTWSPSG